MNRQPLLKYLLILVISAIGIGTVPAQDTHYWNLQYGTRSTLLGGAVIGSVSDMAATYYNPAALALFPTQEILLSGKVYQYSSLTLSNGTGPGKDLTSSTIEAAPTRRAEGASHGAPGLGRDAQRQARVRGNQHRLHELSVDQPP